MSQKRNYIEANPSKKQERGKVKFLSSEEVIGMSSGTPCTERGKGPPKQNNISGGSLPPRKRVVNEPGGASGSQEKNHQSKTQNSGLPYITSRVAWKGLFKVRNHVGDKQVEMVAYLSHYFQLELREIMETFPDNLDMKFYPRSNAWPKKFDKDPPMLDDIGFFLFPQSQQQYIKYRNLIRHLDSNNSIMKFILGRRIELRVYSSQVLHSQFRSINGDPFLWGMILKCKKSKHRKKIHSIIKEKPLHECHDQNTPTNRSETSSSVERTPIAVDKRAEVCDASVKKGVLDFADLPPGFGGVATVQRENVLVVSAAPSESSRRPEAKQEQHIDTNENESFVAFDNVGKELLRRLLRGSQNQSQTTAQNVGPLNACSEKTTGDAPEPDHSETNDAISQSTTKNVTIKQEIDMINYSVNILSRNQARTPVGSSPVISESPMAGPSRRSESQEEREDSSSPFPSNIRGPDLPATPSDSAKRHVETGARGVLDESSPKVQEKNIEQSLPSKKLDTPVTSTPNVAEARVTTDKSSENERASRNGTSSNLARQEAVPVPPQMETPVAPRPNTVQVKQEPCVGTGTIYPPGFPEPSIVPSPRPFFTWRPPFTHGSTSHHQQFADCKPLIRPGLANPSQLFSPCPPVQNFRSPIRPIRDPMYFSQFQLPFLPFPQDLRPPVGPINGDLQFPNFNPISHSEFNPRASVPQSGTYSEFTPRASVPQSGMYSEFAPRASVPQSGTYSEFRPRASVPQSNTYNWASQPGPAPQFRVFSNPSLIANLTNNTNRSYPLPKEEPCDDTRGEGSSRRPNREDNINNDRGNTVISRRRDSRSPVRRSDRRSPVRRRSRSPARNRSRSYSPMSSSSLPHKRREWKRRSPSRSPPRRHRRSPAGRRNRRRSRDRNRRRRSNSPRKRNSVRSRAGSRSVSPQMSSSPRSRSRSRSPVGSRRNF